MDILDEILSSLRLSGGVVIDGEFSGDYCVLAQFTPDHFAPFFPEPDKLISYHYVRSGRMLIEVEGLAPTMVEAGGIAILPRNDPHLLASRTGLQPANASEVGWITADGVHRVKSGTDGRKTEVWCGFLGAAKGSIHPLIEALPPLLTLNASGGEAQWLDSSMRYLAEEQPSPDVVARQAELFLAQAIREYVENLPPGSDGWLRGLADPAVSKALSIIHKRYAEDLDVEGLAREAGVSRSVLGERFAELLGEPPMRYCARWRMRVAQNLLRDTDDNTASIAYAVGFASEAAFNRAFKREFGEPPASWRRRIEEEERALASAANPEPLPTQRVLYCAAHDGTRLAYSMTGEGPPIVKTANWLNHIEYDWDSPLWRHWIVEFTRGRSLVRYDERGNGLSDWNTPELSLDAFVDDLASVADTLGLKTFDLLAISQGAAVAIAYAVRNPDRVRRLIICNGYAQGWAVRCDPAEVARREAMLTLTEIGWGSDNAAYRQLFTNHYIPGASPKQMGWFNEMQRISASPENAVKLQRVLSQLDVVELLREVKTPTLIFHSREDQAVPFSQGETLAAGIPGAVFVPLESRNHILLATEPAWRMFTDISREFLEGELEADKVDVAVQPGPAAADRIEFTAGSDGTKIAFASRGEGFPLVKAPSWMSHLEVDPASPAHGHWVREGSRANRFIRSDMRGFGLSEWHPPNLDFEHMVEDLGAVIDAAGVDRCDLLGLTHGGTIALAYAARHPERVRKIVLVNSFAAGWRVRGDPEEIAWRESLIELNRRQASFRRSRFGEMFIALYYPSATQQLIDWHNRHFTDLGPNENMQPVIDLVSRLDIRSELARVRAPTLMFHSRFDGNVPIVAGRQAAEALPDARFVELDSANHFILSDEPAWPVLVREMRAFLGDGEPVQPQPQQPLPAG